MTTRRAEEEAVTGAEKNVNRNDIHNALTARLFQRGKRKGSRPAPASLRQKRPQIPLKLLFENEANTELLGTESSSPDCPPRTMPISPTPYLRDALQVPLIHTPDCTTHSVPHSAPPWCSSSLGGAVPPPRNLAIRLNPLLVAGITLGTMMVQALPVSATRTATTASIWPPYCLDILICFPQGHPGSAQRSTSLEKLHGETPLPPSYSHPA
ncbi:uncharacterized protein LOC111540314 [Piliocolobus tephrosceles]|uniref:uncharacterized protein LOC111540314 n=1 Tax=Piliocolobus tephrosceles TaxID=591936 RepID=UPI000C295B22|nr:uncharacterized protein LOC111540314 [Piliocolobus tephrosceles]